MPRRLIIILIAMAALIIPTVIIAVLINRSPKLQNSVLKLANINSGQTNISPGLNNNSSTNTKLTETADQTQIKFVSRNFAETYGSGSNQNDFSNIVVAEKWATTNLVGFLDQEIKRQRVALVANPYHEIITKALVVTIDKQSTSTASVTVSTQRQETTDHTPKIYYQDVSLELVKTGSDWKINVVKWKNP